MKYIYKFLAGAVIILLNSLNPVFAFDAKGELIINESSRVVQWYHNGIPLTTAHGSAIRTDKAGIYTAVCHTEEGKITATSTYVNPETGTKVKLYVIGDSTASYYDSSSFPRTGWAQVFQPFFNPDSIEVVNKALSGRSSKSYYTDASGWPTVKSALSEGDYLFIQFGHNDSKTDEERYTDPYTTYQDYLKMYIDEARAVGAIPVLLTSINRNYWSGTLIKDSHGDYPPAMRDLAQEENVPLIDLTQKTKLLFESYGESFVTSEFFMNLSPELYNNYPDGNDDDTHLQVRGAYEVSKLVFRSFENLQAGAGIGKLYRSSVSAGYIKALVEEYNMGRIDGKLVAPMNTNTTLKAVGTGYAFDYFDINGEQYSDRELTVEISDSIQTATAYFAVGYNVRISVDPSRKADYEGNGLYKEGATVTVVAIPDDGYRFVSWTLDDNVVSTDSAYTFTMGASDIQLVINVEEASGIEMERSETVMISYNPGVESLCIDGPVQVNRVSVYDLRGKLVKSVTNNIEGNSIELSALSDGLYVVKVHAGNTIFSGKILKH